MALSLTYRGFNYVDYYNGEYSQNDTLPQVAATGADSVALTPDFGIDVATSSVYAGGDTTDTMADLQLAIQDATAQGLSVFIRPLIDVLYPQVSPNNGAPNYYVPNSFTSYVGVNGAGNTATTYNPSADTQYNGDLPSTNPATVPSTIPAGTSTGDLVNYRGELETTDESGGDLNATKFFNSYGTLLVNEAKAAEAALPAGGSALFSIGTELDALATDGNLTSDWDTLIAQVRAAAPDLKLTYSANWSSAAEVTFWNKLDYVGIDGYVPLDGAENLTATNNPSVATLEQGWSTVSSVPIPYSDETVSQALLQELQNGEDANNQPYLSGAAAAPSVIDAFDLLAEKAGTTTGKLIFSELGYQNDTSAAFDPTGSSNQGTVDPQLQANLYSAFFGAWGAAQQTANGAGGDVDGIPYALVGAYFWDWNPDTSAGGYDDWSPDGYPAETVINSNFSNPITVVAETAEASEGGPEGEPTAARGTVLTGDTDANGATLSISAIQGGTVGKSSVTKYGMITLASNGTYSYFVNAASLSTAPLGSAPTDTISFTVADTNGASATSMLTVTDYRNPTAVGESGTVEAGQTVTATAGTSGTGALAGDSDPDGANLSVAVLSSLGEPESGPVAGNYGTLTLNTNGSYSYVADSTSALASAFASDNGAPLSDSFLLIVEGPLTAFAVNSLTITVTEAPAPENLAPADFYGKGVSAIPLQNVDGQVYLLQAAAAGGNVGNYGSSWNVVGADNFYTDGNADTVLQNTTGQMYLLDMQGNSVVGGGNVGNYGSAWQVVGSGGFFGDGDQGIALQNTDGQMYLLDMQGNTVVGGDNIGNYGSDWRVAATGNFFGDGNDDLVLQQTGGDIYLLDIHDTVTGGGNVGNFGTGWDVVGAGSFFSDGNTDLVLQNTDGQIGLLDMQGSTVVNFADVGNFGSSWQVKEVGDFFNDGHSGIALQNTSGQIFLMELNGGSITQSANLGNYGSTWHIPVLPG